MRIQNFFAWIVGIGALAFPGVAATASLSQPAVDCTPICGSPTCCIANEVSVPTCVFEGAAAKAAAAVRDPAAAAKMASECAAHPGAEQKPLLKNQNLKELDRLSCKWGCCKGNTVARFAASNADLLMTQVSDDDILQALKNLKANPETIAALESAVDKAHARIRICIFCCTF